ncbi:hypothetical protein Tco_0577300, partial [Tanacetum coccineum]
TQSGASMTREEVEELVTRREVEGMEKPEMEIEMEIMELKALSD